jgi:hypothetical protein
MRAHILAFFVFSSGLALTLACGAVAFWLALQNPKFAEPLFNTFLGLFAFGAGAIMGLIGGQTLRGR